ncbi:hypothetical protein [Bosea sp. BK604]|uniref:hypothetical protein n=1 Tax=Bosea sp. BK604 TaxID=2512180 RepID=UPI0010468379|nr:hypothetical protein [Bosea sp. BK604]TCR67107.1 hypothetical protein EV560_103163 [Bosea sp. BK604]
MSGYAFAFARCLALLVLLVLAPWPAWAQESPAEILFSRPHLSGVAAGSELTYHLERSASDTQRLGQPFGDDIKLTIKSVTENGARDIDLRMFTGERARDVNSISGLTGNPLLVIFLDRSVGNMVQLTGGKAPYFKDRLRAGLRDKATSEATKAEFEGRLLDATRITVRPFVDDPNATRMLGYEGAQFEFVVAEAAPGMLLELKSEFTSDLAGAPKLTERIVLTGSRGQP